MVYHYKCPLASNMIIFFNVHELTLSLVELPSGFLLNFKYFHGRSELKGNDLTWMTH